MNNTTSTTSMPMDMYSSMLAPLSVDMDEPKAPHHEEGRLDDEISRVLGILDCAEEVITSSDLRFEAPSLSMQSLEPTPIGPGGVQSVFPPQMSFSQMLNINHGGADISYTTPEKDSVSLDAFRDLCFPRPPKRQCFSFPTKLEGLAGQTISAPFKMPTCPQIDNDLEELDLGSAPDERHAARFRKYQCDQWMERFQDLVDFKRENGHCLVPHNYPPNQQLAQWTKRQRYQYKLKNMNRHSTLTDAREAELGELGFIWDSHKAAWFERLESLKQFQIKHGHSNVPSNFEDRPLAIWVKCQRRQMKLFNRGLKSTMNAERISALNELGFDWNPRNL